MNDIKISKNFNLKEFQCKEGGQVKLDETLLFKLQELRDRVGVPITIVSAYRTPEYNKKCGGSPKSQHMEGKAIDIQIKDFTPAKVAVLAESLEFDGIGIYSTFTHLDVRGYKARWNG